MPLPPAGRVSKRAVWLPGGPKPDGFVQPQLRNRKGARPPSGAVFRALAENPGAWKCSKGSRQHRAQEAGREGAASNARGGRAPNFRVRVQTIENEPVIFIFDAAWSSVDAPMRIVHAAGNCVHARRKCVHAHFSCMNAASRFRDAAWKTVNGGSCNVDAVQRFVHGLWQTVDAARRIVLAIRRSVDAEPIKANAVPRNLNAGKMNGDRLWQKISRLWNCCARVPGIVAIPAAKRVSFCHMEQVANLAP